MYKFRASQLLKLATNPASYFEEQKELTNDAVIKGIAREPLSYSLFDKMVTTNYEKQKQAFYYSPDGRWELEGTADIVTSDAVYDIKNSKRKDADLIKDYAYQLAVYKFLFFTNPSGIQNVNTYLFVDANVMDGTFKKYARVVKVDVSNIDVEAICDAIADCLDELTKPKKEQTEQINNLLKTRDTLLEEAKQLNDAIKEIDDNIQRLYDEDGEFETANYTVTSDYKRDLKYKTVKEQLPWNGGYKKTWKITKKN